MKDTGRSTALLKAIQAERELQRSRARRPDKIPVYRIPIPLGTDKELYT